jgi:hypothetical protein
VRQQLFDFGGRESFGRQRSVAVEAGAGAAAWGDRVGHRLGCLLGVGLARRPARGARGLRGGRCVAGRSRVLLRLRPRGQLNVCVIGHSRIYPSATGPELRTLVTNGHRDAERQKSLPETQPKPATSTVAGAGELDEATSWPHASPHSVAFRRRPSRRLVLGIAPIGGAGQHWTVAMCLRRCRLAAPPFVARRECRSRGPGAGGVSRGRGARVARRGSRRCRGAGAGRTGPGRGRRRGCR